MIAQIDTPFLDDGPYSDHQNVFDILVHLPQVVQNADIRTSHRKGAQKIISPDHLIFSVILIGRSQPLGIDDQNPVELIGQDLGLPHRDQLHEDTLGAFARAGGQLQSEKMVQQGRFPAALHPYNRDDQNIRRHLLGVYNIDQFCKDGLDPVILDLH